MRLLALILLTAPTLASAQELIVDSVRNVLGSFEDKELTTETKTVLLDEGNLKSEYKSTIVLSDVEIVDQILKYKLSYSNKQTNYDLANGEVVGEPTVKDRTGSKDCQISSTALYFSVARGFCIVSNNTEDGISEMAETFAVKVSSEGVVFRYNQSMLTNFFAANNSSKIGITMVTEHFSVNHYDENGKLLRAPKIAMRHAFDAYYVDPSTLERLESTKQSDVIIYQ